MVEIADLSSHPNKAAIVIAAFGSSRRGRITLDGFHRKTAGRYSDTRIYWGYTSRIIRQKTGKPSLRQTLSQVQADGYQRAVILPLQIFPGSEYREICETAKDFKGLNLVVGETLMHRWQYVEEVLGVVAKDFLPAAQGANLLALHGTKRADDRVGELSMKLAKLVRCRYDNVMAAALEGVPEAEALFADIGRLHNFGNINHVRIIPMTYLAGLHVEDDLMGKENSWKSRLTGMGLSVECPTIETSGEIHFKSLASYSEINEFFLQRLEHCLIKLK